MNVAEPDKPVPEVAKVKVPLLGVVAADENVMRLFAESNATLVVPLAANCMVSVFVAALNCVVPALLAMFLKMFCAEPRSLLVTVTAPVAPDTVIPVPATAEVTPVFAIVTAPVAADTLMPVPATAEVTPVLV